jgi:hypothetical protein
MKSATARQIEIVGGLAQIAWALLVLQLCTRFLFAVYAHLFAGAGLCCGGCCLGGVLGMLGGAELADSLSLTDMFIWVGSAWEGEGDDVLQQAILFLVSTPASFILGLGALATTVLAIVMASYSSAEPASDDSTPAEAPDTSDRGSDHIDQIERLAALRDEGVLTNEEFAAEKKKLLGASGARPDSDDGQGPDG